MREEWKTVNFDFEFTNETQIDVSNFGRLRTFNKVSQGKVLNGSMINGYRIIRLKFYTERDKATQHKLSYLQEQVSRLTSKIKLMKQNNEQSDTINESTKLLTTLKNNLKREFAYDAKKRTINYHALIHRLVAEYFLPRPSGNHTVVAHLDYNKLNNQSSNLKWMTREENFEHQQKSPYVIAEKNNRKYGRKDSKAAKLTVTKVMLLKKLLNQGKPLRTLVKQFKITDTQILRIKRGENWADIEAAT